MSVLDKKTAVDLTKLGDLHRRDDDRHQRPGGDHRQRVVLGQQRVQGRVRRRDGRGKGDDIRVAGVKVGTVKDVEIVDRSRALVTFSVDDSTSVTGAPTPPSATATSSDSATSRLTQGIGDTGRLDEGGTSRSRRPRPLWT